MAKTLQKNLTEIRCLIQQFDFKALFNLLGWSNPLDNRITPVTVNHAALSYRHIAELSGVVVLEISHTTIPDSKTRLALHDDISRKHHEHLLIFVDADKTQSLWSWLKRDGKKNLPRSHSYFSGQSGDLLLSKIVNMAVDFADFDDNGTVALVDVTERLRNALDIEPITKKFFKDFEQKHSDFVEQITGIPNEKNRAWYASVLLHRLMFIWFLQKKAFINKGDLNYLSNKLNDFQSTLKIDCYYREFLLPLFFQGFAKPKNERSAETNQLLGDIHYLNGGLFLPHKIEEQYKEQIQVSDQAFTDLFALFNQYSWNLNDTIGGNDDEINPDVLGYIFEKYINQKAFGAYYTRPEITDYLCERTISKLILDRINSPYDCQSLKDCQSLELPTWHFKDLPDLLFKLDAPLCNKLLRDILPSLSLLDPACGSGAFLVAAMKTLIAIYAAIISKIKTLHDDGLNNWLKETETAHPSIDYFIKKEIIKNNLYGVDIMPEATEIAKLRLFLALVSSARNVNELEPLPNIDFNIMAGNSLIGLLTIEGEKFNSLGQADIFSSNEAKTYTQILNEKNRLCANYKDAQSYSQNLVLLRDGISEIKTKAYRKLNELLLAEFERLQIKYEQAVWDTAKNKEGKPIKRALTLADIEALQPFHWGYEFDSIFGRGGFDAIITNPPWEVFKPQAKEFFNEYSDIVSKNKMTIKEFEKEQASLLNNDDVKSAWLAYLSRFPYVSLYFRSCSQFPYQTAVVNGKRTGSDVNLYKLFTEQCFNLLRDNGQCGVIIPSGIYSDLGATGLRTLLFNKTKIDTLFGLSNERFIFEEVDHRFKFCIFTYKKGEYTDNFNAVFRIDPRVAIAKDKLESFLHDTEIQVQLKTDLIKKLSPDSHSVMEFKSALDVQIAEKMLAFPLLGEKLENTWNLVLSNEFHMTNDSYLFKTENSAGRLPLYEGKMIHQFEHLFAEPRYWVDESEGRKSVLGRNEDEGQILNYQKYRLAYRSIGRNTDIRTMIATIVPSCFAGNSINISKSSDNYSLLICVAFLNSFAMDWLLRHKVSANVNMFYVYQLPIPRLTEQHPQFKAIVERAAALICTTPDYDDLRAELDLRGFKNLGGLENSKGLENRAQLRAELDAIIAHLYGLSESEFTHILSAFPIVKDDIKQAALTEFRKLTQ
jgi:hypothetical protein